MQWILVIAGDLATRGIQDPQSRVEFGIPVVDIGEAHAIHLDGEPFPGPGGHAENIDIALGAGVQLATDGDAGGHGLRGRRGVVAVRAGFRLIHRRKGGDMEGGQRSELGGGAQAEAMLSRRAVRSDLETALHLLIDAPAVGEPGAAGQLGHGFDGNRADAGPVEDDLFGIIEMGSLDGHLHRGAALADARSDALHVLQHGAERRGEGGQDGGDEEKSLHDAQARRAGASFPWMISMGRVPKASNSLSASMPSW